MNHTQQALEIVRELAQQLNPDRQGEISPSSHLEWDLGIGSLERLELIQRLEKSLDIRLPAQAVFLARTVRDLLDVVENPEIRDESGIPETVIDHGQAAVPPPPLQAQTTLEALLYQAAHQGDRVLYHFEKEGRPERSVSAKELVDEAGRMAGALAELGVKAGDRVAMMLPTGLPFVASFFAVQWLGAVPVPLYPPFRPDQAEDYVARQAAILDNAGVEVLITFARAWTMTQLVRLHTKTLREVVSAESLSSTIPPIHPATSSDLGLIQYTSGSTGAPKGVALTHANLLHNLRAYGKALDVQPPDVCVSWLPLYHDMGLIGSLLGSVYHGIPLVLMGPQDFLARPSRWLRAIQRYGGTISPAPNFAYELCARRIPEEELEGLDLSTWRVALNGAEAVGLETLERFRDRYAPFKFREETLFPCYGLAEAALAVAFSPLNRKPVVDRVSQSALEGQRQARPAAPGEAQLQLISCGLPLEGSELSVRDDAGQELPERREGRLYFRSGSSLHSYFNNPEATRAIKAPDGWVDTGDMAYIAEGELYLTGRRKDMILKAGRNLHPQDIEDLVAGVEGVRRGCVAAFGVSDSNSGTERLVVVFETRLKGEEARQLAERVSRRVAQGIGLPPDQVVPVGPGLLPKTPSGKIRRGECRQRLQTGTLSSKPSLAGQVARILSSGRNFRQIFLTMPLHALFGGWTTGTMFTLLGIPALVISQFHPALARRLLHLASQLWLRGARLPLRLEGRLPQGPCLIVANHCSLMDPVVVMAACERPLNFLIAPWVYDHPLLARGLRKLGHLRATRGDTQGATQLTENIKRLLGAGGSLAAFPEGGLEISPGLRPFSLGIFQVAAQAGVPIVPMAIAGTRKAMAWPRMVPAATNLTVSFGPPLQAPSGDFEHVVDLARRARLWIGERCGEPMVEQRLRRED